MTVQLSDKTKRYLWVLSACGAAAGFLNGLLGAGGGIVLVYTLGALRQNREPDGVRDTFAATVACVIPMSILSALLYTADNPIPTQDIAAMFLPAAAGGLLGAFLLDKTDTKLLKKLFAALVLFGGIRMLTR